MYSNLIGERVSVVVSSRSECLLEYEGKLSKEDNNNILLENVKIGYLLLNFQKNIFGNSMTTYKENVSDVIINKSYIISCGK